MRYNRLHYSIDLIKGDGINYGKSRIMFADIRIHITRISDDSTSVKNDLFPCIYFILAKEFVNGHIPYARIAIIGDNIFLLTYSRTD